MNSVQENKQELQAAIRACESAISRANATIESMEFRQQAATKMWNENKGREAALERELEELRGIIDRMGDDSIGDSVTIKQLREERDELLVVTRQATDEARLMTKEFKKAQAQVASLEERLKHEEDWSSRLSAENEGLRKSIDALRKKKK